MDCEDNVDIEKSRKLFKNADTVYKFLQVWSSFYENKVCIPTYFANFVSKKIKEIEDDHDNPYATLKLGEKLKEITMVGGIIPFDSQVTVPGEQKGYMLAYAPKNMVDKLTQELNRYSGIVAYYANLNDTDANCSQGLYATYDGTVEEGKLGIKLGKLLGEPMTNIGRTDNDTINSIRKWMSKPVKKIINSKNYVFLCVIAPDFFADPEFIFERV